MSSESPEFEQDEVESQLRETTGVDPDDTPKLARRLSAVEEVKASLRRALQEAKSGQRIPISQMWGSIDLLS